MTLLVVHFLPLVRGETMAAGKGRARNAGSITGGEAKDNP